MPRKPFVPHDPPVPIGASIRSLATLARTCRNCDLWAAATQTVFGDGNEHARVVLVGEQPGDEEDRKGRPFVGPAGRLLDRALEQAGIDRREVYVTNAVKHFKWVPSEHRPRLHKKPSAREREACRPWLDAELAAIRPEVLVLMGVTAAQSVFGSAFRVSQHRGRWIEAAAAVMPLAPRVMATVHPSSILRAPDDETRHREMRRFVGDLSKVAHELAARRQPSLFPD